MNEIEILPDGDLLLCTKSSGLFLTSIDGKQVSKLGPSDNRGWPNGSFSLNQNKTKIAAKLTKEKILIYDLKKNKQEFVYDLQNTEQKELEITENSNNSEDNEKIERSSIFVLQIVLIEFNRFFVICKDRVLFLYVGDKELKEVELDNEDFITQEDEVRF